MGHKTIDPDVHIVMPIVPGYGHVRPFKVLAINLAKMGVPVTFITGSAFRKSIEAIRGVEFVQLEGLADWDMENLSNQFPERANVPKGPLSFIWDMEHLFFGSLPDQHNALQSVLKRPEPAHKKAILIGDPSYTGLLPTMLGSPEARSVPYIALGHMPVTFQSKDTAPFGMGLPSQGEEHNMRLNEMATQMVAPLRAVAERMIEPYHCTKPMHGKSTIDNLRWLPDSYMQLRVPELEEPRSDLRPNFRFCGALLGANDNRGEPEWFQEFVVNEKSGRPLIMVSSGTAGLDAGELILPTIEACRDLPVRLVVCAVSCQKPEDFVLPDNVRWAKWLPFDELFKYVSVVVTNGGYGGINQAFAAGIPMILAGQTEDKTETTARAERTGAAINLKTIEASANQVKDALEKVLNGPTYKEKAMALKKSYESYDAAGMVIDAVNELAKNFYGKERAGGGGDANGHAE